MVPRRFEFGVRAIYEDFQERVKNRLLKEIQNEFDATKAEELASRMCERVVALAGERLPGVPVDYTELEAKREALAQTQDEGPVVYPAGAATVDDHRQIALSKEELRESVDELVRLNVFRPGVVLHCNLCAENNWYHVVEIRADADLDTAELLGTGKLWCPGKCPRVMKSPLQKPTRPVSSLGRGR